MRTIEEVKEGLLQECPFGSGLKVGDIVTYTNDYGVELKEKKLQALPVIRQAGQDTST